MTDEMDEKDLAGRVTLIESMIAEGRRSRESWGWRFVLWGLAYFVATVWSSGMFAGPIWGQHYLAWPVTMIATFVLTWVLASRTQKGSKAPPTTIGRAIGSGGLPWGFHCSSC